MTRPLAFLVNPGAGGGGALARVDWLLGERPRLARATLGRWAVAEVEAAAAVLERVPTEAIVVAAGGDGTANLAAQAVLAAAVPRTLAVLPLGTGNAFAHSIGVGRLADAAAALEGRETARIDVMRTTHPRLAAALVSISVGFESAFLVALARGRARSRALGVVAGSTEAVRRRRDVRLLLDDRLALGPERAFYNAGLYAQPCYAFGRRVFRDADARDGWAEARVAVGRASYWRALASGRGPVERWRRARIESPLPLQADGEPLGPAAFEVRVEPGALEVAIARATA